jgi:hypothetical protein
MTTGAGTNEGARVLPTRALTYWAGEREYSMLETSNIQAACCLTDEQWVTDLLELYIQMLDKGRIKAQVKALLQDVFCPADDFSLSAVHLSVSDKMAKDIK